LPTISAVTPVREVREAVEGPGQVRAARVEVAAAGVLVVVVAAEAEALVVQATRTELGQPPVQVDP